MQNGESLERELYRQISELSVIDTHEHVPSEQDRLELEPDAVSLFENYPLTDLRLSGMSREQSLMMVDRSRPLDERWKLFSQYFPYIRNTSFTRNTLLGTRELYGYDDTTAAHSPLSLSPQRTSLGSPGLAVAAATAPPGSPESLC